MTLKSLTSLFSLFSLIILLTPFNTAAQQNQSQIQANKSAQQLFSTINQRLNYMPDVALYKAQNQLAIENLTREKVVIAAAVKNVKQLGLNPRSIKRFFNKQINAAKAIQYRYRAELLSDPIEKLAPDLNQTIRPKLIELGNKINQQLAAYINNHGKFKKSQKSLFFAQIKQPLLTQRDKQALFNALLAIE